MLYIILSVLIIAICVWFIMRESDDFFEYLFAVVFGVFLGVVVSLILALLINLVVSMFAESEYVKTSESTIIALQDNNSITGSFFLGSGYVGSNMKYVYMTATENEMNMKSVNVGSASLIYSNEKKVEKYESKYKNGYIKYWFGESDFFADVKYKIYVPEGTVKQNYNVDLQ